MISWGLRCFPSMGERSAVMVLAGLSPEDRREVGRLVLDAGEIEDLRGRLADKPAETWQAHLTAAGYPTVPNADVAVRLLLAELEAANARPKTVDDAIERAAKALDRIAESTRQSAICTPPEYAAEVATHKIRAAAFERAAEVVRAGLDEPRGSVQSSSIPEFCHYCGPGYRYGSEGCRHTPPRGSVQPVSYVAEALARVDAIDRRVSGTDSNPTEEGR